MSKRTLTLADLRALVEITRAVDSRNHSKILWASASGYPVTAVVRNFTDEDGNYLRNDDDVLAEGYVWLSGTVEHFLPVWDAIDEVREGRWHVLNGDVE